MSNRDTSVAIKQALKRSMPNAKVYDPSPYV